MRTIQTAPLVWHNYNLVSKEKINVVFDINLFVSANFVEVIFTNGTEVLFCNETVLRIKSILALYQFNSNLFSDQTGEALCNEIRRLLIRNYCYKIARCFYVFQTGTGGVKANEFLFVEPNPSLFSTEKVLKKTIVSNNYLKPAGNVMCYPTLENEYRKIIRAEIERAGADDCIILDQSQYVLESYQGNIFLIEGKQVYTPSPQTGCFLHLLRDIAIGGFYELGFEVIEKKQLSIEILFDVKEVIIVGSNGIFSLKGFEFKRYFEDTKKALIEILISRC